MPWSVDGPPSVAKNWTSAQKKKCVDAANAVLDDGGSEEEAIFACISAAGKSKRERKNSMPSQKKRSERYGIEILPDGNENKPADHATLSDSQWGDPVNYLYPVPDAQGAETATKEFRLNRDAYEEARSARIVKGRINRLARKYEVEPIKASQSSKDVQHFLVGEIKLASPDDEAHEGLLRIPAARTAVLDHPWWGDIHLDDDLFESFIDNWETNVVGYDLAIDPDHEPHQGALAWVKDITFEGSEFDLWVAPTSAGDGILGDVWRYASIEYTEDYTDPETGVSYGPTLLGCAATNRPFVHRQDAIQVLSQDVLDSGETPEGASFVLLNPKTEVEAMNVLFDDEDGIVQDGVKTDGTQDVELSQPAPVTEPVPAEPVEDEPQVEPAPAPAPAPPAAPVLSQPAEGQIVLSDGSTITAAQVAQVISQNVALQERDHKRTVAEVTDKALARGVAPVVVETARQILLATSPLAQPTITLSVPDEGANVEKSLNLFGAITELLSLVPGRITEMPLSYSHSSEVPDGGFGADSTGNPYLSQEKLTPEEAEAAAIKRREELKIRQTRMAGDPGVAL